MIPPAKTVGMLSKPSIQRPHKENQQTIDVGCRNMRFANFIQQSDASSLVVRLIWFCHHLSMTPDLDSWHTSLPFLFLYAPNSTPHLLLERIVKQSNNIQNTRWQQTPIVSLRWDHNDGWLYMVVSDNVNHMKFKLSPMGLSSMLSLNYHQNRIRVIHTVQCVFDCNHVHVTRHRQLVDHIFSCIHNGIEQLKINQDIHIPSLIDYRLTCCVVHQLCSLPTDTRNQVVLNMLSTLDEIPYVSSVYITMTTLNFILVTYEVRIDGFKAKYDLILRLVTVDA